MGSLLCITFHSKQTTFMQAHSSLNHPSEFSLAIAISLFLTITAPIAISRAWHCGIMPCLCPVYIMNWEACSAIHHRPEFGFKFSFINSSCFNWSSKASIYDNTYQTLYFFFHQATLSCRCCNFLFLECVIHGSVTLPIWENFCYGNIIIFILLCKLYFYFCCRICFHLFWRWTWCWGCYPWTRQ